MNPTVTESLGYPQPKLAVIDACVVDFSQNPMIQCEPVNPMCSRVNSVFEATHNALLISCQGGNSISGRLEGWKAGRQEGRQERERGRRKDTNATRNRKMGKETHLKIFGSQIFGSIRFIRCFFAGKLEPRRSSGLSSDPKYIGACSNRKSRVNRGPNSETLRNSEWEIMRNNKKNLNNEK